MSMSSNKPWAVSKLVDRIKNSSPSLKVMGCLGEQHMTKGLWVPFNSSERIKEISQTIADYKQRRSFYGKRETWNQNPSISEKAMSKYLGYYMIPEHNYWPIHSLLVIRNALHGASSFDLWIKIILKIKKTYIGAVLHPSPNKPSNLKSLYSDSLCLETCYEHEAFGKLFLDCG